MKKLIYIFLLLSFICRSQSGNYTPWYMFGNSIGKSINAFIGTKDNTSLFLKTYTNTGYIKYDSLGNFIWRQTTSTPPPWKSTIQFSNWVNSGTNYPCIYMEVTPTKFNYAIYSDSLITTFNGPQTIGIVNQPYTIFNATATNPAVNGNRYIAFASINTSTATLSGSKTHILMQGCTWGFNGTPTITPTKFLIGADTYSATNVTVFTSAITLDVPRPIAGTNVVITNSIGLRVNGNTNLDGKNQFGSTIVNPSGIIQMPAGSATNPALKLTSQTALSSPANGDVYFNGSIFFLQGDMSNNLNNITVGTSSVGSSFTASGAAKMTGITNIGNITSTGTGSCGTTFTSTGIVKPMAGILGSATNDAATAGNCGEFTSAILANGSALTLTTNVITDTRTISLTAGDWDVSGNVNINETTSTVTERIAGISLTSATIPTDGSEIYDDKVVTVTSSKHSMAIPVQRISTASTITIYLVVKATFSAGTEKAYGSITARRMR